jgi:hypothetical protein
MPNELIQFWQKFKLERPPFAHPDDLPILRRNGRCLLVDDPHDFDSYVASSRFGPEDNRFHLSLLPVPYVGDIKNAEIIISLLNPGFESSDYWAEFKVPQFRNALERNLCQDLNGVEFPFMYLDPQFCWHGGYLWWEGKLRSVIQEIARHRFKGIYLDAMRSLSSKLACVELIPYHSSSFGDHKLIDQLPSVQMVRRCVSQSLIADADAGKRTLIVTRQAKAWGVHPTMSNVIVYEGGHTRGAHLTPNSDGGQAILKRYGISA